MSCSLIASYINTGKEYNWDTGLFDFRSRDYNPKIGRFISEEPLGIDGPNLYWYTQNNPVNYIDPNGLETQGYGGSLNFSAFGFSFTASANFTFDDQGNYGLSYSYGLGGAGSSSLFGASALGEYTYTNARTIYDLCGNSIQIGGSVNAAGYAVGSEFTSSKGKGYTGYTFGVGLGGKSLGFSQHVIPTKTNVIPFSNR